jgi:hypothetical protein
LAGRERREAGKNVAKRRRLNGSIEEGASLADPPPVSLEEPADGRPEPARVVSLGTERTELLDPPVSRLPAPHMDTANLHPEPEPRSGPPEAAPIGNAALAPPAAIPLPPLEMRIRRLEDALAQLQAMRGAEHRVTAQPGRAAVAEAAPAAPAPQAPTDKLWEFGKRVLSSPGETARALAAASGNDRVRAGWLFVEIVTEARVIWRMFTDPRYRLSWTGRIAPPVLVALVVVSSWWVPLTGIPVFGMILDKVIDLVMAFVLFKILGHEARRYRETAPDLPPSLRL